ncbi:NUDIX domain-containing protein [Engelhardtia mirabilis]|uniref:NUDIX domain-containing protein n=1 Tax=Engelhardtia mirabilis TaxID=2528011 RepID=UPI003AF3FF54
MEQVPTHAGGVVVRPTLTGPLFLMVRSRSNPTEWVLPKGHIERVASCRETPEATARREVEEETGVVAEVVAPAGDLCYSKEGEDVVSRMFLMRFVSQGPSSEGRETRWASFEDARRELAHPGAVHVLESARLLTAQQPHEAHDALAEQVLMKQLDLLHERMKETSATANDFLAKFLFGGMIAVIALLNADLVLLDEPLFARPSPWMLVAVGPLLLLTAVYFGLVTDHLQSYRRSHRKLKYKFELTLHSLLQQPGVVPEEYSRRMELSVGAKAPDKDPPYPESGSRSEVLDYLVAHHRYKLTKIERWNRSVFFWLAMVLVLLTLAVRLVPLLGGAA